MSYGSTSMEPSMLVSSKANINLRARNAIDALAVVSLSKCIVSSKICFISWLIFEWFPEPASLPLYYCSISEFVLMCADLHSNRDLACLEYITISTAQTIRNSTHLIHVVILWFHDVFMMCMTDSIVHIYLNVTDVLFLSFFSAL